jgi:hypothetical protein
MAFESMVRQTIRGGTCVSTLAIFPETRDRGKRPPDKALIYEDMGRRVIASSLHPHQTSPNFRAAPARPCLVCWGSIPKWPKSSVWDWLNTNSAAVQSFAAILSAGTTVVLAALTAWYVALTKRLAGATQAQLKTLINSQKEQDIRRKRELSALLKRFEEIQQQLPWHDQEFEKLLSIAPWTEKDIESFQAAMIGNGPGSAWLSREIAEPLRWLLSQHQQAQSNPEFLARLDRQMYRHHLEKVRINLLQMPIVFLNDSIKAYGEPFAEPGAALDRGGM